MHALKQASGVIRALQSSMMVFLKRKVSKANLKIFAILAKRLILVA